MRVVEIKVDIANGITTVILPEANVPPVVDVSVIKSVYVRLGLKSVVDDISVIIVYLGHLIDSAISVKSHGVG